MSYAYDIFASETERAIPLTHVNSQSRRPRHRPDAKKSAACVLSLGTISPNKLIESEDPPDGIGRVVAGGSSVAKCHSVQKRIGRFWVDR